MSLQRIPAVGWLALLLLGACHTAAPSARPSAREAAGYPGKRMRLRSATPAEIEAALPYDLEELLGNLGLAQEVSVLAQRHHRVLRYHLALNSAGMSRNRIGKGSGPHFRTSHCVATPIS